MINRVLTRAASSMAIFALVLVNTGCDRSDSRTYDEEMARTGRIQEYPRATIIDLVGEALISVEDNRVDDRTRVAALLDALRELAMRDSSLTHPNHTPDTLECTGEWDGLKLAARTIRSHGMVIRDVVRVTLEPEDDLRPALVWYMLNMKLISPGESNDTYISILKEAMLERGFSFEGNHRLGRNIWCEKVCYRRWEED